MSYERNRKESRSQYRNHNGSFRDSMPQWVDMSNLDHWGQLGLKYAPHYYHSRSVADSSTSGDTNSGPFSKQVRPGFQRCKIAIILIVIGLIAITAAIIPILVITLRPAESQPDKIRVVTMKLSVDAIFRPEYYDKSSSEYQSFEANFSDAIEPLYNTGSIKGYSGLQIQELRNGSIIVIFIIVIEVKQNQDPPRENELKAIITEQPLDTGDQNFVLISKLRIQKTSVTVESAEESQNNPLSTKRTISTTTSTSTSTTTATTTSTTTPTTANPSTTSTTSTSTFTTIPTTTSTTSTTANPSTTSTTSTSTFTTIATTTSTTSTTANPSTSSTTSTSTSTTIPATNSTTSATANPSTTSTTSTSTSTTIPTTTSTTSPTTVNPSTTSTTSTSTFTTIPTTTSTTSTTAKPSTTSTTSTSTSTTIPTTNSTTSTTANPSTTSTTSTSTSTTIPTTTSTKSTTAKPSTASTTSTSTSTTIPTTTSTTSTTAKPSTTSTTSTSTSTTIPTTTSTTSTTVKPSTTSTTSTSTLTTIPTTTSTTSTTAKPSTTSTTSTSTSTTIPSTTSTTSTTTKTSTTSTTSTSTSTTIPTTTSTTTAKPSTTSSTSTSTSTSTTIPTTTSTTSTTNAKLITNSTTSTSSTTKMPTAMSTTSPTIAEPSTTSTTISTSTSTTILTSTITTSPPTAKPSTASTESTTTTTALRETASTIHPPTTKASTTSSETTTTATTVDKTMSPNETMTTTFQQPTTTPALITKTEIYFGSNLYSGFVGSFVRLTCQASGMSHADLQTITIKKHSTSNFTEFVASISMNGTKSSNFQDISISSEGIMNSSKAMIHLDFHKLACADNGTYYCITGNYSATGDLIIFRKPENPVLTFPLGVLENEKATFSCSGEVGYPPGTIVLETNNGDGKTFVKAPFSSTSNVIHGNCSAMHYATFSFNFTSGWNNTIVRCRAEKSQALDDNETSPYVDKIILIVPANICETSNALYIPHPYDCHKYIECGIQTYLRDCPAGLCRFTHPHNNTFCDWTCDTCTAYQTKEPITVRSTPQDTISSTFQTTIPTSGNITIPSSNRTDDTNRTSTSVMTTTERVSDKTNASTTITTPISTEIYFTRTSYSGFIGSSVRLTCQVQRISPADLQTITIKRNSTSSGTEFVASISANGTKSSDFQDISIISESFMNSSKATIHVDFHKLACTDEGTYYCMIGDVFATGILNILRKPEIPILTFPQGVMENSQQDIFNCTGEVGHPPGNIVFETNKDDGKTFIKAPFYPTSNVKHGNCSATYYATFSYKFTSGWNNTIIRCRAENTKALDDNETSPYVDKRLLIVQANICETSNALYIPHPYECHNYIECGMQTYLRECPAGLCRFTQPHNKTYCDWTCDTCIVNLNSVSTRPVKANSTTSPLAVTATPNGTIITSLTASQTTETTTVRTTPQDKTTSTFQTTLTTSGNITISSSNRTENTNPTSTSAMTTTEKVFDKTIASTPITTQISTEIYFTSISYSGFIGSSVRLTCQVQQISPAVLQTITIKRNSSSSGTEFVASIYVNGTKISDFQDISIISESFMNSSKATIHVDFHKLACTDEGIYYCMIGDVFATAILNILRKPEIPILTFPQGVLENSQQDIFNCTGEVGHPPGNIVFETNKDDGKTFIKAPFYPTLKAIHGNCSATYYATFSYKFTMGWNNTIIRCRAENTKALDDNETSPYHDKRISIVPANICDTTKTLYIPHPYDCHKYIECGMQTYLRECPAGLCRFTQPHNNTFCDWTCTTCTDSGL